MIEIADVLSIFYDDSIERQANPLQFERRIERLNEYWGGKVLAVAKPAEIMPAFGAQQVVHAATLKTCALQ